MKQKQFFFWLLFVPFITCANHTEDSIGIFDLSYTLQTDLSTEEGINTAWDDVHAVSTLQGIVNRSTPRLYIHFVKNQGIDIDAYWWNKYSTKGEWLDDKPTVTYHTIEDLFAAYGSFIDGVVVYDETVASTSNVASAIAGIENLVAIRWDKRPGSLYSRLVLSGPQLPIKKWLVNTDGTSLFTGTGIIPETTRPSTGSIKNDSYIWFIENYVKKGKCNTEFGAYYIDQQWKKNPLAANRNHHTLTNHDFFVSKKAFFFDLSPWGDEPATDETRQPVGTDLATLKELLLLSYQQNQGKKICYIGGFPPWAFKYTNHVNGKHEDVPTEWEYARIISAYNAMKDADAINIGAMANASFWQHFPLDEKYEQSWVTTAELKQRGLLTSEGKVNFSGRKFFIFYVGDYDASSWITQETPIIWDNSYRGRVPLMWAISPVLQERAPMVLHNFRKTATSNDYFVSADNGAGYLMPGMLQEPRPVSGLPSGLDAWAEHCKKYFDKWGLTVTGFIVDGLAPGLNEQGLDCYESFSPNGIVPQKTEFALLHNNMPVLKSGPDVNNNIPREAAEIIVTKAHSQGFPFLWFRNILKTPYWYTKVVEEIQKKDANLVLLDAPSFFELLRIHLKSGPFAGGSGTVQDPYLIETPEQFDAMRTARDKCFRLIADLDFQNYIPATGGLWWPIGEWGAGIGSPLRFSGAFDGNTYTIRNLKIDRDAYDLSLFGVTEGASIMNLKLENIEIKGAGRLGSLTGATFNTSITCCASNNVSVINRNGSDAGGITGPLYNSTIKNCYSTGYVYAKNRAGGISSFIETNSEISNCYTTCKIESDSQAGGISGGMK